MASITTTNISAAAGQTQPPVQTQRQAVQGTGANQEAQNRQPEQVNPVREVKPSSERAPETPKRVDASFDAPRKREEPPVEKRSESPEPEDSGSLNVIA